jgi:hypothetical protein
MSVPEPVMSLAVAPKARDQSAGFSKALNRFSKEDPTFRASACPGRNPNPKKIRMPCRGRLALPPGQPWAAV